MEQSSPIQEFFSGTTVFVTGATGFMGKCLLEKLLGTCPEVSKIYILVREKRGKALHSRVEELFQDVLFTKLKEKSDKFRDKVVAIAGDISSPGLALSPHDRSLLQDEVDVVFHVAATVNFNEKLRLAMAINVNGTKEILDLCRGMRHLKSVVHVSTAYCNCHLETIDETFYKYPMNHLDLQLAIDKLDDRALEELTPRLLGVWPNTYTFTKAMAEDLVNECSGSLPLAVFRPAIVVSTWKEPVAGWIDNIYGPTGICVGAMMGVLGTLLCDENVHANIVPVDMAINALISCAWDTAVKFENKRNGIQTKEDKLKQGVLDSADVDAKGMAYETPYPIPTYTDNNNDKPLIYNYVSTVEKPLTWAEFMGINILYGSKYPLKDAVWCLKFGMTTSPLMHKINMITKHMIPAILVDSVSVLIGKKPSMMKVYRRTEKFCDIISHFCTRDWSYSNNNVQKLWQTLDEKDQRLFPFSIAKIDWLEYFHSYVVGVRKYLCKDDLSSLPVAERKRERFLIASKVLRIVFYYISVYAFLSATSNIIKFMFSVLKF